MTGNRKPYKMSKPTLIKSMRAHEKGIKQLKDEFLANELNDTKDLELCLQKVYQDMEPVYQEIMNRYKKQPVEIFYSKIGSEKRWLKELSFPFRSSSSQA